VTCPKPVDTAAVADLRDAAHGAGTLACIALLTFAAGLALSTLSASPERKDGERALNLAERMAAGENVDPDGIVTEMHSDDEGIMIHHQLAPPGPQAEAWAAVVGVLGLAAWHGSMHRGWHPNSLVEGWRSPDALDFCIDPYLGVPHLDWTALGRAAAWMREHAPKASEGWGEPLRVEDIRQAAFSEAR